MRATDPLNRTFRPKAKKTEMKLVKEKHYTKYHAEEKSMCVHVACPHCGKTIAITFK
jgi:hypothetical protein